MYTSNVKLLCYLNQTSLYSIINSIKYVFDFSKQWQEAKVSFLRVEDIITLENDYEIEGKKSIVMPVDKITIRNLKYRFSKGKDIFYPNMSFEKGNIYLLSGDNGAGKTTLLNILSGVLYYSSGEIVLNKDLNLSNVDFQEFRECCLAFVRQEANFWNLTVRENVSIFLKREVYLEDIQLLIKDNCLSGFATDLFNNNMWNRNINELSVGQRKKIMICLQIIRKKNIIFLDEPFAFIDEKSVFNLWSWIEYNKRRHIIIIVSHDDTHKLHDVLQIVI